MPSPNSITLRFLAEPTHVNLGGKVHGGAVMKWIDQEIEDRLRWLDQQPEAIMERRA